MNKSILKIALLMLLVTSLVLAGCGGKDKENKAQQGGTTTAQKPYVYVPEYHSLDTDYIGMNQVVVADKIIYYIESDYVEGTADTPGRPISRLVSLNVTDQKTEKTEIAVGENTMINAMTQSPEGELKAILFTYMSEAQANQEGMQAAEEGGTQEAAGEEDKEAADPEGTPEAEPQKPAGETKETKETKETGGEADQPADDAASDTPEETKDKGDNGEKTVIISEGNGNSGNFVMTSTGSGGSVAMTEAGSAQGEDMLTENKIEIVTLNQDGTIGDGFAVPISKEDSQMGINAMLIDNSGRYLLMSGQKLYILEKDGSLFKTIEVETWIDQFFKSADGTIYAAYYGKEGMEAHPIDVEGGKFGDTVTGMELGYGNMKLGYATGETDFLFSQESTVYTYNLGDEKRTELFDWLDSDIDYTRISTFGSLSDSSVFCIISGGADGKSELVYLTKKSSSEVKQKQILTLGTLFMSDNMRKMTIDFNKNSQDYRIQVKLYGDYNMEYAEMIQKMNTDIASGNVPDIINLNGLSHQTYAVKGVFEDLNPYFEKDAELKKEDFVENALNLFSINDKLYAIAPSFIIDTVMASSDLFGDKTKVTIDDLIELQKQLPKEKQLFAYVTKESILRQSLAMNLDRFVDWNTGECKFNSEEFMKTLEFANMFPKDYQQYEMDTESKILDGSILLVDRTISSVQDYQIYEALLQDNASIIGYPTEHESGSFLVTYDDTMAISSKCANKDAAWQFVRGYLTDEFQGGENRNFWGFPVSKKALDEYFAKAMEEEYYQDMDGKQVRGSKTSWGFGSLNMEVYAANQKQADTVRALIESTTSTSQMNDEVFNIILEEAAPFFEGQKNAKAVADIIQSRLQIYVNENR